MALPLHVDKLETAPEYARGDYIANSNKEVGGFVLDGTSGGGLTIEHGVSGLKAALGETKTDNQQMRARLAKFVGSDGEALDPDAAFDAITKLAALGDDADIDKKAAALADDKVRGIETRHKAELDARDKRIGFLSDTVTGGMVRQELVRQLTRTDDGRTSAVDAGVLARSLMDNVRAVEVEADGEPSFELQVFGDDRKRRVTAKSGSSDWMGVEELVDEGRAGRLKPFFKAVEKKGTMIDTGGDAGKTTTQSADRPGAPATMNARDRLDYHYQEQARQAGS